MAPRSTSEPILLLSGFEPFGGERNNPSWEVASGFDAKSFDGVRVRALRLPVAHRRAVGEVVAAIRRWRPAAVIGLGQAGGRTALALERVAVNLLDKSGREGERGRADERPVVRDGPDAYFSRLPLAAILRALERRAIPAALSLNAGAYICNAVMYAALHELRRRPAMPVGFIHLPYEAAQAVRRRAPSMSLELMERGVATAISVTAAALRPGRR